MPQSSNIDIPATSQEQACAIISSAIHHLLFAKGQIYQPISVLRKQRDERERKASKSGEDESQSSGSKHPPKKLSFTAQRKERKLNELIENIDRLHHQLVHAIEAATASNGSSSANEVVIILRLGQSPLSMARQQFKLQLNGILSLPRTADEADKHNPPKIPIARQVFGGKINKSVGISASNPLGQSSMSRVPVLERKLVRFFLSANMEESLLGKALSRPIGPTRSQIFLQAPKNEFAVKGWIPKSSLRIDSDDCLNQTRTESKHQQSRSEEGNGSNESASTTTAEDVDTLALGLSPVKRRALMSPSTSKHSSFAKSIKPMLWRQDSDFNSVQKSQQALFPTETQNKSLLPLRTVPTNQSMNTNSGASKDSIEGPALTSQDLFDQKRMARMRARPVQSQNKTTKFINRNEEVNRSKPLRKQQLISASIIINFTSSNKDKEDQESNKHFNNKTEQIWYASDIILQAYTFE